MMMKQAPTIAELQRREQQKKKIRELARKDTGRQPRGVTRTGNITRESLPTPAESLKYWNAELRYCEARKRHAKTKAELEQIERDASAARATIYFIRNYCGGSAIQTCALDAPHGRRLQYT